MTKEQVIAEWSQGAERALEAGKSLERAGFGTEAMFHCHLATVTARGRPEHATAENARQWLDTAADFLKIFLP